MTTATAQPAPAAPRPLPMWLSIPIILVCLAAGTGIIYWYIGSRARAEDPHVLGDAPAARPVFAEGRGGPPRAANRPGGGANRGPRMPAFLGGSLKGTVRQTNNDPNRPQYDATANTAHVRWTAIAGRPPFLNALDYGPGRDAYTFVPDDARRTIAAAKQLADNKDAVAAAKVPPDAVGRLRGLADPSLGMAVSEADRSLLLADLTASPMRDAPAKAKLLADVDAIAERSRSATVSAAVERARQINALVTPEEWAAYKAYGGGR